MTRLAIFLLFSSIASVYAQTHIGISGIKLKDDRNKVISIESTDKNVVILFMGTDCPITQKYITRIKSIVDEFSDSVDFYGVFPSQFSIKEIKDFKKEYNTSIPLLRDENMELVKHLKATVTPEAFLLDKMLVVQYQGAIDNWFYELGKYRQTTTEEYLIDGLKALANGEAPSVNKTEAIGCLIQMPAGMSHEHH